MAPRKDKKTEKKKEEKEEPLATIAYTERGFTGELLNDGRTVVCHMLARADKQRSGAELCLSYLTNEPEHIRSHINGEHNEKSARYRATKKNPDDPFVCPCDGKPHDNWVNYLSHLRRKHDFKGVSRAIREAGGAEIDEKTNRVIGPRRLVDKAASETVEQENEGGEEEEEDDGYEEFFTIPFPPITVQRALNTRTMTTRMAILARQGLPVASSRRLLKRME
ncbi:hypothetical protein PG993_010921 [Apiospora rasikravindrae]|uniref:Uncharacterized protein n=1 Tax=Apiospora rasikravindrae TaxID=990691 RepID=A0ABR1SCP3_9PEZI